MSVKRLFVEKKTGCAANALLAKIKNILGITCKSAREFIRYDIEGLSRGDYLKARDTVFSEPPVDNVFEERLPDLKGYRIFATEYLPGQFDLRADSAEACVQLLLKKERPRVRCAVVYALDGGISKKQFDKIKKLLINPVECREASPKKPKALTIDSGTGTAPRRLLGFIFKTDAQIAAFHAQNGFAMSVADLCFVRDYFRNEHRDPTETELKVVDTYWSDHCRHTTFLTELTEINVDGAIPPTREAKEMYERLFVEFNGARADKYPCLMDMATIGAKAVRKAGGLENLDESEEINACSIKIKADVDGKPRDFLVMFKNETHNHPTEIEPFGGAATCLGGAIRDPLSGRSYVYQAMRLSGAADPRTPYEKTLKGKLPQSEITRIAAAGFSSYGNQIGLATGMVSEVYHPDYVAKRLETGFVVGAVPAQNVVRATPVAKDKVILLGGATGRDGCGGATGSSKAHTSESVTVCGAEVQKGNPPTERKLQRLFRDERVTRLIKRCNDFGAGGVSVAIGELAEGLDINLDAVPKKYDGLSATETAISESQERMAVVVAPGDVDKLTRLAAAENLSATVVAEVTDTGRMKMFFRGECIVDLARSMLNTNGVKQSARARIENSGVKFFRTLPKDTKNALKNNNYKEAVLGELARLNVCSNKGMSEMFDSTIGAGSVFLPFGGKYGLTPALSMAAKIPLLQGETDTATVAAWGFNPALMSENAFVGSIYSVLLSVIKVVLSGAPYNSVRLTLQEYFMRLRDDERRWGVPAAALLGALFAEVKLNLGAIGGKDSMSGSFEDIDVPPTLISFALGVGKASRLISNVMPAGCGTIYRLSLKRDKYGVPDLYYAASLLKAFEQCKKTIAFATMVEDGGAVSALIKSALGSRAGIKIKGGTDMFLPLLGDVLFAGDPAPLKEFAPEAIAESADLGLITVDGSRVSFAEAEKAYTATLSDVFPITAPAEGKAVDFAAKAATVITKNAAVARPKVFIPVFPGTNCEYDTARRFEKAGAESMVFVVRNSSSKDITDSARTIAKMLGKANILMIPGGFSGGDEPDGSGKFIASTFSNPRIADAVRELLYTRDGLALGICNGFQALIKLGLLPFGVIEPQKPDSATLTFNNIGRHVSTIVRVRVASTNSPWLSGVRVGDVFNVPVSHGEGKFICNPQTLTGLVQSGQVATQYVDIFGKSTMESPYNPNGSVAAIEGIISPDGRILGKMGHAERIGDNLYKNAPGNYDMKIFESGVGYYK